MSLLRHHQLLMHSSAIPPPDGVPDNAINITSSINWTYAIQGPAPTLDIGTGWPDSYAARGSNSVDGGMRVVATSENWNEAFTGFYVVFSVAPNSVGGQAQYSFSKASTSLIQNNTNAGPEAMPEKTFVISRTGSFAQVDSPFVVSVAGSYFSRTVTLVGVWVTQ